MQATDTYSNIREGVLKTLRYFNIFHFPLHISEICNFLPIKIDSQQLQFILNDMVDEGNIYAYDDVYMIENRPELAMKRVEGTAKASMAMEKAKRAGTIIARFPFVKSVCISGSLSKGYADEKSDIDFFIVTSKRRLWICRTLLHLFKKTTFLYNEQHSYCMNYFIDETHLCLEEKNLFTATELATLIPLYSKDDIYTKLIRANAEWLNDTYPNAKYERPIEQEVSTSHFKKVSEFIINIFAPKYMNLGLMHLTDRIWRFKWQKKNYPMHEYDLAMKTKWYVSKNHPANYQKKVLSKLSLTSA